MRRRKRRQPAIIGRRLDIRDGELVIVTVYEGTQAWGDPQNLRCKTKRTAKVCDPDISQRPRTVQPARRV